MIRPEAEIAELLLERFRATAAAADRRRDVELEERFRGEVGERAVSIDPDEQAQIALDLLDASPLRRHLEQREVAA